MTRFAREQSGQMLVLSAAMMMVLIMFVGLAIDAGRLYGVRRTMQEAADAGAYAGAVVLYQKGTQTQAFAAAREDAKLNGYEDTVNGASVIVRQPTSGPFTGNPLYVEVIIETTVRTALMPQVPALTTVRVRGVGGSEPLNNQYAIMALDRGNTPNAFQIGPGGDVHLTGGGILVNSTNAAAATNQQNDACRLTITPSPHNIDLAGNTGTTWPVTGCLPLGTPAYTVGTAQPQQADPFAEFPKPLLTGCDPLFPNDPCVVYNAIIGTTIGPGIYTVSLSGAGGTTLYLRPGTYILKAGMNGSGNADFISMRPDTTPPCAADCGVFIFNTHSNYDGAFGVGATCGGISLVGNATSDLRARTTGTYANFLFYQDAACTNEMVIAGNGTFNGTGTIYLPSGHFRFNGNPSTLSGSQLIANTVDLQNGNITINFDAANSAQPILPRLAE